MGLAPDERAFVSAARVGHLATASVEGTPNVVPFCFALVDDRIVSALDEKPKDVPPTRLQRVRNIRENPAVSVIVDRYEEDWNRLGWVRVDGRCTLCTPSDESHGAAIDALRGKYDQYADHHLEDRPVLDISPRSVTSWGELTWS